MPPLALLAVAAVGAGISVYGNMQGQAAAKQAQQAQTRMNDLKAARERTTQIRNANAAKANITQSAANTGTSGSSSAESGAENALTQAYGNNQYIGYEQQTGQSIDRAKQKELNAQGVSSIGSGISDVAGTVLAHYGDIKDSFSSK